MKWFSSLLTRPENGKQVFIVAEEIWEVMAAEYSELGDRFHLTSGLTMRRAYTEYWMYADFPPPPERKK